MTESELRYYIEGEDGKFLTKPGSGCNGFTGDWRRAWSFPSEDRVYTSGGVGGWPYATITTYSVLRAIEQMAGMKLKATRHQMIPLYGNGYLSWRCGITHDIYTEDGRVYNAFTEHMTKTVQIKVVNRLVAFKQTLPDSLKPLIL